MQSRNCSGGEALQEIPLSSSNGTHDPSAPRRGHEAPPKANSVASGGREISDSSCFGKRQIVRDDSIPSNDGMDKTTLQDRQGV
jgi:hypothetical protein